MQLMIPFSFIASSVQVVVHSLLSLPNIHKHRRTDSESESRHDSDEMPPNDGPTDCMSMGFAHSAV